MLLFMLIILLTDASTYYVYQVHRLTVAERGMDSTFLIS